MLGFLGIRLVDGVLLWTLLIREYMYLGMNGRKW